jgi:hypothetical protein
LDKEFPMIWAENTASSQVVMHTSYGSFETMLSSKGGESKVEKKKVGRKGGGKGVDWLFVHGIVLWLAWFVFGLTMVGLTRWFVYVSDKLQYVHAIAGWAVTAATAFGAMIQVSRKGLDFAGPHSIAGTLMLAGVLPLALSGAHAFRTKENAEWSTERVRTARKVHRRLALLFWLLSLVALSSGLAAYARIWGSKWAMLAPLNLCAMLLITIGLEARFRW